MSEVAVKVWLVDSKKARVLKGQRVKNLVFHDNGIHIVDDQVIASAKCTGVQSAGRLLGSLGINNLQLEGDQWSFNSQWFLFQGLYSANSHPRIQFTGDSQTTSTLKEVVKATSWCRELINTPANVLPPMQLMEQIRSFFEEGLNECITFRAISGNELNEETYPGLFAVGKGSKNGPGMLIVDYNPSENESPPVAVAMVGKGVTFDSGGYSIKNKQVMAHMKADMAGAATLSAALYLAIVQGLAQRVVLVLCCAENMISSNAYRPGDILEFPNGLSVEVVDTDAEGRLILADGLLVAQSYHPEILIDAASLTGAAVEATGGNYNALFSMHDKLSDALLNISRKVGDPIWPLPLEEYHGQSLPSKFADISNSSALPGGGAGAASTAAGFLSRFVHTPKWAHLDLASCYKLSDTPLWSAGATGTGVNLVSQFLLNNHI